MFPYYSLLSIFKLRVSNYSIYKNFIAQNSGKRVLFLELGVGMNTPGIIKYPFIDMTYRNKKARYVCINTEDNFAPLEIEERSLCIKSDLNIICQLV